MKIKYQEGIFAPMLFLDKELEEFKDGYPNSFTEDFYETLKRIRDTQNSGLVPEDSEYIRLCKRKNGGSVEYGYCTANIHYYLYESCSEYEISKAYKDSVNKRILFFVENADEDALFSYGWFPLNFVGNYFRFLENQYDKKRKEGNYHLPIDLAKALVDFVERYGDDVEIKISKKILEIVEKY